MRTLLKILCLVSLYSIISCDDILEVPDISNASVTILAPTQGVVVDTTTINFSWESVIDAEQYQLQIATPTFETARQIIRDTILEEISFSTTLTADDYEWRVRALNSEFATRYTVVPFTVIE